MIDYITGFSFLIIDFYATLYLHIGKLDILINFANTWFDYQLNITELQNFKKYSLLLQKRYNSIRLDIID